MNRKFISKSNRVLRKVLNAKENLDVVKDFIETFLPIEISEITLNPYLKSRENNLPSEENFGIADVRVRLKDKGEERNIGIQFIDGYYAQNKMLLYYAQIHANQLEYPDRKEKAKTVTINLLDFDYLASESYLSRIAIPSKSEGEIELYVIELPKFEKKDVNHITKQEAWMLYLCGMPEPIEEDILNEFSMIKKLNDLLENYWRKEVME